LTPALSARTFACQVIYCRDKLGIPDELLNVNGGAISIGHPYGMSGSRMVGHALIEGKRRKVKYVVITMALAATWAQPGCSKSPEAFAKMALDKGAAH
jgi:acetyl-CoA C-acetyltransferase